MDLMIKQAHIATANKIRRSYQQGKMAYDICRTCPTAQALLDLGYENVSVGVIAATATGYHWGLPQNTYDWIMRWTSGDQVYPITLALEEEI